MHRFPRRLAGGLLLVLLAIVPAKAQSPAERMQPTVYADGFACPANCDAHVVFDRRHNGTRNAFRPPLANRAAPAASPCVKDQACMICFDDTDASCMEATYRGAGPHRGRFDVTPAFLTENCGRPGIPAALATTCATLDRRARAAFGARRSCIADPSLPDCRDLIAAAVEAQRRDRPDYLRCVAIGARAFNRAETDPNRQRSTSAGCGYALNIRKSNSLGQSWQVLLPGSCRDGTLVNASGLDCCTGIPMVDVSFGSGECRKYYR